MLATYRLFYAIGTLGTLATVALLGWIAFCIAIEAEPLASIAFLPDMSVWDVFVLIAIVFIISIAAWQKGAALHQQYEDAQSRQLPRT